MQLNYILLRCLISILCSFSLKLVTRVLRRSVLYNYMYSLPAGSLRSALYCNQFNSSLFFWSVTINLKYLYTATAASRAAVSIYACSCAYNIYNDSSLVFRGSFVFCFISFNRTIVIIMKTSGNTKIFS